MTLVCTLVDQYGLYVHAIHSSTYTLGTKEVYTQIQQVSLFIDEITSFHEVQEWDRLHCVCNKNDTPTHSV